MTAWTFIRFLHVVALVFFVGGQLMLVAAVAPAVRRHGTDETMRLVARRFGIGSVIALAVLIASGAAMASHHVLWSSSILQAKIMLLVLVGILLGLHVVSPRSRFLSLATLAVSLFIVWLGLKLTYG